MAGDDYYKNSTITTNVELNVDKYYKETRYNGKTGEPYTIKHPMDAHSADVEHPEIIKEAQDKGTLRKLNPVPKKK